ncbi:MULTISPECIES: YHS domain-containing (seleno)protein [Limnobacter]|uniref:YHS domain-containing (seleno)protein n=1 Tax=Limnobacter TaxID=131079 RepID=UPI0023AE9985|nr:MULTISPECIES: YHS domain-containing (seleno)protein [unclassified Limnobacter]
MRKNFLGMMLLAASALVASVPVLAADELNLTNGYSAAGAPLAIHGYDPVSYFTDAAPALGDDSITVVHDGAAYRFSSKKHAEMFKKNPSRYVPQFGGYCAFGVSVGKKFDGDPRLWTVYEDKLYLNLNSEIQNMFSKDVAGAVQKANKNWVEIRHKSVSSL